MIPNIEVIYILVKASRFKLIWFNIMRILIENDVSKCVFVAVFLGCTSTGRVDLCFFVVLCPGTPEGSTGSGSGF